MRLKLGPWCHGMNAEIDEAKWGDLCSDCRKYPCASDYTMGELLDMGCFLRVRRNGVMWIGEEKSWKRHSKEKG